MRDWDAFTVGVVVKNPLLTQETREMRVCSLGREDPLEEGLATHPSTLAWKIWRTEEPGRLQSTGPQRVGMTERARTRTPRHSHAHTRAFAIAAQARASPGFWVWGHLGPDIRGPLVHGGTKTVGVLIVPEVTSKKLVSRAVLDPHRRDGPTSGADEAGERDRLRRRSGGGWKGESCCLLMPPLSQVY